MSEGRRKGRRDRGREGEGKWIGEVEEEGDRGRMVEKKKGCGNG